MGACLARLLSKDSCRIQRFQQLAGEYADADPMKLLNPPEAVSAEDGAGLANMVKAMISKLSDGHKARIFLTFAVGQRESDASGFGPGTYYAAALSKKLWDEGVLCFSPLMLPDTATRDNFRDSWHDCRKVGSTLLVVKTAALYNDLECLKDIYTAQVNKIKLLPLRFEADVPNSSDAWPQVTKEDLDEMLMVSALGWGFFQLNSIPSPPYTLLNQPFVLEEIVTDLKVQLLRKSVKERKTKRDATSQQSAVVSLLDSPHQCKGSVRNPEIRKSKLSKIGEIEEERPEDTLLGNSKGGNAEEEGAKADVVGQTIGRPPIQLLRSKSEDEAKRKAKKRRDKAKGAETGEKDQLGRLNKAQTDNSHEGSPSARQIGDDGRPRAASDDGASNKSRLRTPEPKKLPKKPGSGDRKQREKAKKLAEDRGGEKTVRA